jgi:hypothetical protein
VGLDSIAVDHPWPEIRGSYSGDCLVVCTAKCVWDDLAKVPNQGADVLCVNDSGLRFPGDVEHWYSSHADALPLYREIRRAAVITHSMCKSKLPELADWVWPWPGHGNSGLNAIYTALGLGYGRVWVCGLPMDNTGHFNDGPSGHWLEPRCAVHGKWSQYGDRKNFKVWERAIATVFDGRVTFMSGRFA